MSFTWTMLTRKATKLHQNRRNKYLICVLWMLSLYLTSILKKASNIFLDANDAWQCYRATDIFISLSIFFGLLVGNLWLGYKSTLNSIMYANMWLWALLDYVKELCLLHYVEEESHKATSKLKKHVFDMCVMNAIIYT